MPTWQTAAETVAAALQSKQIGTPVAARVQAHLTADHGAIESLAARTLFSAGQWMGAEIQSLMAQGGVEAGQITTLARYTGGQSVLVSTGTSGVGRPLLEVLVHGNHGLLSWEGSPPAAKEKAAENLQPGAKALLSLIRKSLSSGQPVSSLGRASGSISAGAAMPAAAEPKIRARKPPFGVLLVAGDHTHQPGYAENLAADKRCRLIGLTDEAGLSPRRQRLNEQMARRLGIPFLPNLQQALARDDVHVVSICAEPQRRGPIIVAAAKAGKHLYLDKPLTATLAEARAINEAVSAAGVVAHMWSMVRYDISRRMRELVQSDRLGDLRAIHLDLTFAKGHAGGAKLGQQRRESVAPKIYELAECKRELSNVGVYPLVTLLWLLGKPVRRVFASTGNYFFPEHQAQDMEDFGQLLLTLEGGLTASISVGRTGWSSHRGGGLNRACLIGTKRAVAIDTFRPRVAVLSDAEPWVPPPRDPEDPMAMWGGPKDKKFSTRPRQDWFAPASPPAEDVAYFLDCIEHGRVSDVDARLAGAATEILLAGYQSVATGQVVELPLAR